MKKSVIFIAEQLSRGFRAAGILALLLCLVTVTLQAQYREDPVDDSLASKKSDLGSNNKELIEKFAKGFYLARWTQNSNIGSLHSFRKETADDVGKLRSEAKKTCQDILVGLFAEMAQAEDLRPAVRYNAALAIGMFNEREAGSGGTGDAGVPYTPAISVMADMLAVADGAKNPKVPDYVILAILIGLERYAALGIPDDADRAAAVKIFLSVLDPSFAKKREIPADVAAWLQKKAVDGLALFATPSDGESATGILDRFVGLLRDKSLNPDVLCAALQGIGTMKFDEKADLDYEPVVGAILEAAARLNKSEISFIDEENIRSQVESAQGAQAARSPAGGMPVVNGNGANIETVISRIKFDKAALRAAIDGGNGRGGVLPQLTKESQQLLKDALEAVLARIDRTNNYLDFGEEALQDSFDVKKVRRPKANKNQQAYYMVNSMMVKLFLNDEVDFYQDQIDKMPSSEKTGN